MAEFSIKHVWAWDLRYFFVLFWQSVGRFEQCWEAWATFKYRVYYSIFSSVSAGEDGGAVSLIFLYVPFPKQYSVYAFMVVFCFLPPLHLFGFDKIYYFPTTTCWHTPHYATLQPPIYWNDVEPWRKCWHVTRTRACFRAWHSRVTAPWWVRRLHAPHQHFSHFEIFQICPTSPPNHWWVVCTRYHRGAGYWSVHPMDYYVIAFLNR